MTALVKERFGRVKKSGGMDFPVKGGVKIWKGAYVVLSAGFLAPATAALSLTPTGKSTETVDNTLGADGDVTCHADFLKEKTLFPFLGDPLNLFDQADMGGIAYLLDDQTVTTVSAGHSEAGTPWRFEGATAPQTVWVEV